LQSNHAPIGVSEQLFWTLRMSIIGVKEPHIVNLTRIAVEEWLERPRGGRG